MADSPDDPPAQPEQPLAPEDRPPDTNGEAEQTISAPAGGAAAPQELSQDEWLKAIRDPKVAHIVNEVLRGRQIASVYIDARSGGAFFSGETRIEGDVVSGGRAYRTQFGASVSGTIHTGSGDLRGERQTRETTGGFAGRVLAETLRKINTVYVAPNAYPHASQLLEERHLLILWGPTHGGKWTSALHLLASFHEDALFELDPTVTFEQFRVADLAGQRGYVLDTITPEQAEQLTRSLLSRLSEHLYAQKSRLVITVDQRVALSTAAVGDYLVRWEDVPSLDELLSRHLPWYVADVALLAKAQALCDDSVVQQLLQTNLRPGDIDRLAELVAQAVLANVPLNEVLARFEQRTREQVADWFETHTALAERTLMVAVAVLNGAAEQAVFEAQARLQTLIRPPQDDKPPGEEALFGRTRSQRVKAVLARVVDGHELAEFGPSPVKQLVLENPTLQPTVLRYIWEEYDQLRPILLTWLRELGLHPSFEVRARAASAVGELSKFDFGYVRQQVLLPWANHEQTRVRQSAALALGVPVWEGALAPQVLGLLHHWSTLRNNPRLCWTAAVAYGGLVGLRFPDAALRDLQQIAQQGNLLLFEAASRSILTLFLAGAIAPDYFIQVLATISAWVGAGKETRERCPGLLVFLMLAQQVTLKVGETGESWPAMLWLTHDQSSEEKITRLWRRALNSKGTRTIGLAVLHGWCRLVDEQEHLYASFARQITRLATQGEAREGGRLRAYLARWRAHPKQPSASAGRILQELQERKHG